MRPTLLPNLRRLWRDAHTIQLGTAPATAVLVEFPDARTARLLDLLDGTRTEHAVLAEAEERGIDVAQAQAVLDELRAAGVVVAWHTLLPAGMPEHVRSRLGGEAAALALRRPPAAGGRTPADTLRRRGAARVIVTGEGPLIAPIATTLAGAGIGHVDPAVDGWVSPSDVLVGGLLPTDANRSRAIATTDALTRTAPETRTGPLREGNVSLLVHVGARMSTVLASRGFRSRTVPRLDVTVRDGVVFIGPLVRPTGSPCRDCLELHRRDRDPAWPAIAAQLATSRPGETETCAVTTGLAAAAYVAEEVLAFVDGTGCRTEGATVEVWSPGTIRRRTWHPHPRCDCRRRRRSRSSA